MASKKSYILKSKLEGESENCQNSSWIYTYKWQKAHQTWVEEKQGKKVVQKCTKTELQIKNNKGTVPSLISDFVSVPSRRIQSTKVEDGSTI